MNERASLKQGLRLVSLAALASALGATNAYAQAASATTATGDAPTPPTAQPDGQGVHDTPDGEIVVTATRQAEVLSRVPISVEAFSPERLDQQGVRSIDDLSRLSPGVTFTRTDTRNAAAAQIAIRGINSTAGAATTGVYIDDTPIQSRNFGYSSYTVFPEIFDLERVEVLRGPQGTLFGAGAEGGAIRFITPSPDFNHYSVYGRAEFGVIDGGGISYEGGVAVGGPIVADKVAFRVSAWHRRDGGYVDPMQYDRPGNGGPYASDFFLNPFIAPYNAAALAAVGAQSTAGLTNPTTGRITERNSNYQNTDVLRGAIALAPTENLTLTASIYYQNIYNNDGNAFWLNLSDPENGKFSQGNNRNQPSHDKFYLPSLKAEWDAGPVRLISNTSYFNRKQNAINDYTAFEHSIYYGSYLSQIGDVTQSFQRNTQENISEEFRIESADPEARLSWVVGAFYTHNTQKAYQFVASTSTPVSLPAAGCPAGVFPPFCYGPLAEGSSAAPLPGAVYDDALDPGIIKETQLAGFAQADFKLTEKLKFTAGVRIARTDVNIFFNNYGPVVGPTPVVASAEQKETPVTPKFGISYQADADNLFYASIAKGFRTGGGNPEIGQGCGFQITPLGFGAYKSDSLWSYEIGAKSKFFNRKLQVNGSAYYVDWKNIQQNISLACGFQFVINSGGAVSKGFDLDAALQVTDHLQLSGAVGYNHAEFKDTVVNPAGGGNLLTAGDRIAGSPWQVTASGRYDFPVFSQQGYLRADYQFLSAFPDRLIYRDPANGGSYNPAVPVPGHSNIVNLRLGVQTDALDISVFAQNVFNVHPLTSVSETLTAFSGTGPNLFQETTLRPRVIGMTAIARFR